MDQSNRTKVDVRGPDTGNGSHGRIWQFSVHDLYAWHDLGQPQLTTIRHVEEAASDDEVRLAAARVSMVQHNLIFREWCDAKGATALPASAETVAAYLAAEAGRGAKASTLGRRVAAIRYAHKLASHSTPTDAEAVKATLRGIRRTIGAAKVKKVPAIAERVKAMVRNCPDTVTGKRDRALLLLGFAGAFRRSELVALDIEHIEETVDGLRVLITCSKTDQEGAGATIAIARGSDTCPVRAL